MSEADKDGQIAQWMGDRLACLGMEMAESAREAIARFNELMAARRVVHVEIDDRGS